MTSDSMFILRPDNTKRKVDWVEFNQLKKDILWVYDENLGQINAAFVPSYSFDLNYWEYLTLQGLSDDEKKFYQNGVLVILLCQCVGYIPLDDCDQEIFNRNELPVILKYVSDFVAKDAPEHKIKAKILLGLNIAISYTNEQLLDSEFVHKDLDKFYTDINAIGDDFILAYYDSLLKGR